MININDLLEVDDKLISNVEVNYNMLQISLYDCNDNTLVDMSFYDESLFQMFSSLLMSSYPTLHFHKYDNQHWTNPSKISLAV